MVVMGATGAGKTTLARCLTRIVPCFLSGQVEGELWLQGVRLDHQRPSELAGTIGMVFQDFEAQIFSTDVTQEVVFGLEQTAVPPSEMPARVEQALQAVGLAGFEGRDPTTLSGGEKQRLAIAALLAQRPQTMVFDEPTTDLDPAGRTEVLRVIASLRTEGLSLLVIEHDTSAAVVADQLLLLRDGRIVGQGPPRTMLADVTACTAAGVRPPDVSRVFATLGLPDPPLDPAAAAEVLRRHALIPTPPASSVPAPRPSLVHVNDVSHRYPDGRLALCNVNCTINRGELVAVVGHNGSGKTMLAKHLNGLLTPTVGRVLLDDTSVADLSLEQLAQRVGYVFQDPDHQLFAATVEEEVAFGPRNVGLAPQEVEVRVTEALAAVGLEARQEDPFLLGKGARQRLAVATILALRPEVLVLDEPTTGLDYPEQQRMLRLLHALHRAGRTIIIITHTPWVIAEYAERVLMLAHGELRYDGPTREFFANDELIAEASFKIPDVTRLGRALGCTPLSVDELLAWLPRQA